MLSADFGHLERDTRMVDASAAEWVHISVISTENGFGTEVIPIFTWRLWPGMWNG